MGPSSWQNALRCMDNSCTPTTAYCHISQYQQFVCDFPNNEFITADYINRIYTLFNKPKTLVSLQLMKTCSRRTRKFTTQLPDGQTFVVLSTCHMRKLFAKKLKVTTVLVVSEWCSESGSRSLTTTRDGAVPLGGCWWRLSVIQLEGMIMLQRRQQQRSIQVCNAFNYGLLNFIDLTSYTLSESGSSKSAPRK